MKTRDEAIRDLAEYAQDQCDALADYVLDWLGRTCMPREQFYAQAYARCIQAANAIAALRARADLPPTDEQIMAHPKVRALVVDVSVQARLLREGCAGERGRIIGERLDAALRDLKGGEW